MQSLDTALFHLLTAGQNAPGWVVLLAGFLASWVVPLVLLALLVSWFLGRCRPALLDAVASGLLGLGIVQLFSLLLYRPRPFEVGLGLNLMRHVPENSFPSDHATLMFALAVSLAMSPLRRWGLWLIPVAIGVGWGRVYLGAHYPLDILGGAVLGTLSALVVRSIPQRLTLWALIERIYLRLLSLVH